METTYNIPMSEEKGKAGRLPGVRYGKIVSLRFTERQHRLLTRLARKLDWDPVQVVREAVLRMAEQEGLGRGEEEEPAEE